MSESTTSAGPPSQPRTAASAPSARKSSSWSSAPGIASTGCRSMPSTRPTGRPFRSPSAFTRATATCVQPPGAQPRSTTRAPGFRNPNLSSISLSLNAARLR